MGAEYKEDCVFCPDHARQVREDDTTGFIKGTDDCIERADNDTQGG